MKAFLYFFHGWLGLYFVLLHFVVPFYLVATYPKLPEPAVRLMRGFGYGVVQGPPSEIGFWYLFVGCGAWVAIGLLTLCHRIKKIGEPRNFRQPKVKGRQRVT